MADKTAQDVVTDALRTCRIAPEDDVANVNVNARALALYKGFHRKLQKEFGNRLPWNYDAVPEEEFSFVSGWFAGRVINRLPVGDKTYERVKNVVAPEAEADLREILARKSIKTVEVDFF